MHSHGDTSDFILSFMVTKPKRLNLISNLITHVWDTNLECHSLRFTTHRTPWNAGLLTTVFVNLNKIFQTSCKSSGQCYWIIM